jgi:hypothetical protein
VSPCFLVQRLGRLQRLAFRSERAAAAVRCFQSRVTRQGARVLPQPALAALAALALLLPSWTEAAETKQRVQASRAAAIATRQARTDALAIPEDPADAVGIAPPRPGAPPPFSIDVLLPALWNSNPAQASQGLPSPEVTPGARLGWTQRLDAQPIRLSAVADLSADRFSHMREADADLLYGRLRAQYESGADDQEWQPFASYTPTLSFTPAFARRTDTWHDLAFGAAKAWKWDAALRRVPPGPDTEAAAIWTFALNGAAQRRERDGGPASAALLLNPSVTWTLSAAWNASLEVEVTRRWYDRFEGHHRSDWLAVPVLTVEFTLPEGWLPPQESRLGRAVGAPALDLQIFLTRQTSTEADGRFHQWGLGPVLRTAWKF